MRAILFFSLFSFSFFAHADVVNPIDIVTPPPRPIDIDVDFQPSYFETYPWIKEFRYVLVVNKAIKGKEAQTIKVYEFGTLVREEKVSTGREEFEPKGTHHSKKDMWTVTQTGYYSPTWLDKNHRSDSYGNGSVLGDIFGGVKMPYSIFFNGGTALHEVSKKARNYLGQNISGGCVRLPESLAEDLFQRIKETKGVRVPDFRVNGTIKTDENGNYSYRNEKGFSALIVVKNKIVD